MATRLYSTVCMAFVFPLFHGCTFFPCSLSKHRSGFLAESVRSLDPYQSRGNPWEIQKAGRVRQRVPWVLISSGSSVSEVMATAEDGNSTGGLCLCGERKGWLEPGKLGAREFR